MLTYAQALLVDRKTLLAAQQSNDTVAAQEILQNSFRTDTRALVAEARLRSGAALDPLSLYRREKIREQLTKERGAGAVATGL
jgi:L-rhamnose isomerase/sugar isomerase